MKGLNVKRIAALAAGAAILGATLAAAGAVTYSNTPIISAEGVPQVKIVVGAKAAASDGVAAANIAALIGNLAFKSQEVTATVSGAANLGCTVSGGTGGTGTCAVSNEKVTLEVTVPGTVGGVYPFNTYINDWVDKKLENRLKSTADDFYNTSIDLSPFASDVGPTGDSYAVRKITATDFPALQSPTVTDPNANKQYKEDQSLWFQAHAEYSTTVNKRLQATNPKGAYQIEFTHDQAGIPVGTCDATVLSNLATDYQDNSSYKGDYTKCADQDLTDRHRVHIGFLGDSYIISQMTPPTGCSDLTSSTSECEGGSINLAKESAYNTVHVGENLTAGAYVLKLEDIEAPLGNGAQAAATIAIYDSTGALLKEDKFYPSTSSYTWTAPDGSKVRIRVYKTNPGYYAYAKWAEIAVYSQEFTLTSGDELNSDNSAWTVKLIWRNKDPTYDSKDPDALRKIILYNSQTSSDYDMGTGDTYDIVTLPVAYQIEFGGITLGSADYDTLTLSLVYYSTASFGVQTNFSAGCSATTTVSNTNGNLLEVRSLVKDAFQLSGTGTFQAQRYYYFLGNESYDSPVTDLSEGDVIFQKPGGTCWYYMTPTSVVYLGGDATSDDGPVAYNAHTAGLANLTMQESASTSSGITDLWRVSIHRDSDNKDKFLLTTTATKQIYYTGVSGSTSVDDDLAIGTTTVEPGYTSERGTQFVDVSTYGTSFKRARRLGELKFFAKTTGTEATTGTTVGPLAKGESANVGGGVTVKVKDITETVGTCTVGTNAQCTVTGKEGLSATPSVTSANVRTPLNPSTNKLVVLDKDADKSATLIVVGGNLVNIVAAEVMQTTTIDLSKTTVVAQPVGNSRILVAGYTAADTVAAADKFIQDLIAAAQ